MLTSISGKVGTAFMCVSCLLHSSLSGLSGRTEVSSLVRVKGGFTSRYPVPHVCYKLLEKGTF